MWCRDFGDRYGGYRNIFDKEEMHSLGAGGRAGIIECLYFSRFLFDGICQTEHRRTGVPIGSVLVL